MVISELVNSSLLGSVPLLFRHSGHAKAVNFILDAYL